MDAATACDALATVAFGAGIILDTPGIKNLGALEDMLAEFRWSVTRSARTARACGDAAPGVG